MGESLTRFFSYLVEQSVENMVRGGILVWEVVSSVFKATGNGLLLSFFELILYVSLFYIVFGSGQGVHNFHHLGQWKDDSRSF